MNTFGSPTRRFPLYNPRGARIERVRFGRESAPGLQHANSIYVPTGRYPTRGWILLAREDYDELDTYSTALQLEIGDSRQPDNVAILKNLSIVQAQCVTRGMVEDEKALYLVELTDGRGLLQNKWFQFPLMTQYNIRAPAYPQTFHPASMNGGTTWTWSTMVQDIWTRMGTFLGAWSGLPTGVTPLGTPEGFWFPGVPAWTSLCEVLDHLGLTVACDLTQDSPFTIVQPGAADSAFAALQTKYGSTTSGYYRLEDDLEFIDTGAGRVPGEVIVLFRRRNSVYGTEETVRYDLPQWDMAAYYSVTVNAPATFSDAVGSHYLWSDFTVRYDQEGNPLGADVAEAAAIAAEQVTEYFANIYHQTLGHMHQVYAGALPFTTGSRVDGVAWYQTHGRLGWRTKIVRGNPPFSEIYEG